MLILIVVAAATALAAFVASYQKTAQSQSALAHERSLEDLKVIDVNPIPLPTVTTGGTGSSMGGTVTLTVNQGTAGSVTGSGFSAGGPVTLTFGLVGVTHCMTGSLNPVGGSFACVFVIPEGVVGTITVSATDGTNSAAVPSVVVQDQTTLSQVQFTLASLYISGSIVTAVSINGLALSQYCVDPPTQPPPACVNSVRPALGQEFNLSSQQQVIVSANVTSDSPYNSSFFYTPATLQGANYLKIEVFTYYGNDFAQSFVPPTAIAIVDSLETTPGAGFVTIPVLDGSQSLQPGNATIESWSWSVTNTTVSTSSSYTGSVSTAFQDGEKVVEPSFDLADNAGCSWSITLTVTNSDGLFGLADVSYTAPGTPPSGVTGC